MYRKSDLLTVCLMASLLVAVACGGERQPAQDEMTAEDMEMVADEAYDEAYDEGGAEDAMPIAPPPASTECVLSDDYLPVGSSGLEFRVPQGGNSVRAWQVTKMEYDRETMMDLISGDGALTISEVEAPIGTIFYTQHEGDDMTAAKIHIFEFTFELDGKWWKGGLPVRNLNAELATNCAALMPQTLASLRRP